MIFRRFYLAATACAAAALQFTISAVERGIALLFGLISGFAANLTPKFDLEDGLRPMTGVPVDRALQNDLRHEAGFYRCSSARGC